MRNRIGIIICSLLIFLGMAGCSKSSGTKMPSATNAPDSPITSIPNVDGSLTVAPSKTTELPIYTISGDLTELTAVTALVSEDTITEQIVTDAVVDALEGSLIYVKVNNVSLKDEVVTVDFNASSPPVSQVGASIEGLILDAFGQSLLDNVPGCKGISFTVDGGMYSSGHFEFATDEIYMRR